MVQVNCPGKITDAGPDPLLKALRMDPLYSWPTLSLGESLLLGPGCSSTSQTMMVAFSPPLFAVSLESSLYPTPRHSLPISRGTLYFMRSYLKLELNQIQGIIGVCTGIT